MADPAVDVHNDLHSRITYQAARYRTSVSITGPFAEGDPAHVDAHNKVCIALIRLRDVANGYDVDPVVTISLPDVAAVGDTGHIADHALIEAALDVIEGVTLPWE